MGRRRWVETQSEIETRSDTSFFLASMHVTGLSPLAIVLPQPRLPRVANNLPPTLSTPRTPRTTSSTLNILVAPLNRNSTDSWNSSNGPDEHEWDWKPEQVRLLSRVCFRVFHFHTLTRPFPRSRHSMHSLLTSSLLLSAQLHPLISSTRLLMVSPRQKGLSTGHIPSARHASNS